MTIKRQPGNKQFSDSVEYNGVVYVRGFTADDKNASMKVQTQQVLAKIDKALAAHGTNKSKILSATIYHRHGDQGPDERGVGRVDRSQQPAGAGDGRNAPRRRRPCRDHGHRREVAASGNRS